MENKDRFIKYNEIKVEPTENQLKAYMMLAKRKVLRKLQEKIKKEQEKKKAESDDEQPPL